MKSHLTKTSDSHEVSLGTLYDFNKQLMSQQKPLSQEELSKALTEKFKDNEIQLYNSTSVSPSLAGTFLIKSLVAVTILGSALAANPELIDNAKPHFSDTMAEPVDEIIKYLSKSKSARMRLENPPIYKPKKQKKKGLFSSMLGM